MEPDNQLGLPGDGTPSLLTGNLRSSEDGTLVYAGQSSIYLTEAGSARQLKLQEDGNVHRACWVSVSGSEKLVAVAQNSVQIWNADGSLLYLCWALPPPSESFDGAYYACSVAAVSPTESIYVGSSAGDLFAFSVAGDMVTYKSTAAGHDSAVTALVANDGAAPSMLVSGSASGEIKVWDAFSMSTTVQIAGGGFGVTALALCEGFIIAGFETGHVRTFDVTTGAKQADIAGHMYEHLSCTTHRFRDPKPRACALSHAPVLCVLVTRCFFGVLKTLRLFVGRRRVTSVELHPSGGTFLTAGEDGVVNVFTTPRGDGKMELRRALRIPSGLLTGATFGGPGRCDVVAACYEQAALPQWTGAGRD